MNETSSMSDLQARLQKKAEQDRQQIETVTQGELKKLAENLRQSVKDESYIIVHDIKQYTQHMNSTLWWAWFRSVSVGVMLFLGICVGSWGLTRWLSSNIQNLIETRAELQAEIEEQRRSVERLQETTWGVWFHEEQNERYLVLPAGTEPKTGWTVDGQPAVKLSSE